MNGAMRIAFLGDGFLHDDLTRVNGTQVQMYNLASALAGRGNELHFVIAGSSSRGTIYRYNEIRLHWLSSGWKTNSWLSDLVSIGRVLDKINPDVLYQRGRSHLTYAASRWAAKNQKRFVWGSNGEDSCEFWKNVRRVARSPRALWKKLLLYPNFGALDVLIHRGIRRSDFVVNQTEHQQERLQKNFAKQGCVLPSYFPFMPSPIRREKESTVLWLANSSPGKQPHLFLDLADHCRASTDWQFLLGGPIPDTAYGRMLNEKAERIDNVMVVGAVPFDRSGALYAQASLFVSTSLPEADGLPNAFIQAWQHGTPILSLHHDPNDWIRSKGLGYCANGDLEKFFANGLRLLGNSGELQQMGERCQEFALEQFGDAAIIDTFLDILSGRMSSSVHIST